MMERRLTKKMRMVVAAAAITLLTAGGVAHAQCTDCTFFGTGAGTSATGGGDSGFGVNALNLDTGGGNTAIGQDALDINTTGSNNTATGGGALFSTTTGSNNTAIGGNALGNNPTGSNNTAVGYQAGFFNFTGSNNTAVGWQAGSVTTGDNNIDIGNVGVAGESKTIRIGTKGTQTRAFVAGISNSPIFGAPVVVNANGRLGIQASSARFKRDIRDMGNASDSLLKLRPVSFRYKEDPKQGLQYGLIAEEVERVYPQLVIHDDHGKVMGVRYDMLPALLVNEVQRQTRENQQEMQKQTRENQQKDARIAALQQQLVAQCKQIAALQQQTARIDTLTARLTALEEQASIAKPQRLASALR